MPDRVHVFRVHVVRDVRPRADALYVRLRFLRYDRHDHLPRANLRDRLRACSHAHGWVGLQVALHCAAFRCAFLRRCWGASDQYECTAGRQETR